MTSHTVLVLSLVAMLAIMTSADLERRSITDNSGEPPETSNRTWRPTLWIEGRRDEDTQHNELQIQLSELQAKFLKLSETLILIQQDNNLQLQQQLQTQTTLLSLQQENRLLQQQLQTQVQNLSETIILLTKSNSQQCKAKIAELNLVKLDCNYYYFANISFAKTWHEALSFCKSNGMELLTIENSYKNDLIFEHLRNIHGNSWEFLYWLGGNDLAIEGTWVWSSTGQPVTFTSWVPGYPNGGAAKNCMLNTFNPWGKWLDHTCTSKSPFICEMREPC